MDITKIYLVGAGKLANAIWDAKMEWPNLILQKWPDSGIPKGEKAIIIHAGSGRQLQDCVHYCEIHDSILVELSTGLLTETLTPNFTLVLCPNTSILILKAMYMVQQFGTMFQNYQISLTESHQSTKTSVPGTAYAFANSLKIDKSKIKSIRDGDFQINQLHIPKEYVEKHAYHNIEIMNGSDSITIETKVLGHESYVSGVKEIISSILKCNLKKKTYTVFDLISLGLI